LFNEECVYTTLFGHLKKLTRTTQIIKFIESSGSHEITPVDIGILELKSAVNTVEAVIDRLHSQIDELSPSMQLSSPSADKVI
jgi:hypothetical protein